MKPYARTSRRTPGRWTPVLLAGVTLLLYLTFRSPSLDDFDSYSFALALQHFDLALQQPQPPGFPVYVAVGRVLYHITGNPATALAGISAISGAGVAVLIYALGHLLDDNTPQTGILAALLVSLTPLGWLTAEKALSDTPGLFATLLPVWLLITSHQANSTAKERKTGDLARRPALAAFVTGLALGVRPQNALPLALLWIYVLWHTISPGGFSKSARTILIAALCGLTGIAVWLIPTTVATGGLAAYITQLREHAGHVGRADSLLGMGLPLPDALRARAMAFAGTFLTSTTGVGTFAPWRLRQTLTAALAGTFVIAGLFRADWRRRSVQGLALWAITVTAQVFFFETLDRPRLMLPILPPVALLVAHGWSRMRHPRWLKTVVTAGVSVALLAQGVPLAAQLATIPAPPAQATAYVAAHFPLETTLIATAGSFRAVQVELPGYQQAYLYRFDANAVQQALASGIRYVVIFDRDQFPTAALATLSDGGRYVPLEERTFSRDRRVHTQHDQVRVQVLTPAALVPRDALVLPEDGCIDVGDENYGRYLAEGWFRPENIGGTQGRWAGETLTSTVRVALEPEMAYRLHFRALAYPEEQTVTIYAGNREIERVALVQGWAGYEVTVPADALPAEEVTTLALVHAVADSPFNATGGGSADTRALTAAYAWICFERTP